LIRGDLSFEWFRESDHVVQRADGTCLYHLASVVDDFDFKITHVVRAIEHLSNTPRQIFIAQSLGYPLPQYAHIPFVAEPGSKNKLSKRKIAQYLNNKEFNKLYQSGAEIASRIGLTPDPNSFNPVLVDFYREVGFLPDAVINYLLLLGWSLDDRTEFFSRQEMTSAFSLDRVVKSEASFDPQKLTSFQGHYMNQLPAKQKAKMCLTYLQRAGLVTDPPPCEIGQRLQQVVEAAGDRLVMAGDILKFDTFFRSTPQYEFDEKAFQKRILSVANACHLMNEFNVVVATAPEFKAAELEQELKTFCEQQQAPVSDLTNSLRIALTGVPAGFSLFDSMEILGRQACIERINRALEKANFF
jgi:glutamyl-tRNA synthetase